MRTSLALAAAAFALTACGGGGAAAPVARPDSSVRGTLTITVPNRSSAASTRRPAFVSPSATQATIADNGSLIAQVGIGSGSAICTTVSGARVCTIGLSVQPGPSVLVAVLTDASNNVVGVGLSQATIAAGFNVTVPLLPAPNQNGYNLAYAGGATSFVVGTPSTATATFNNIDYDGNAIPPSTIPAFPTFDNFTATLSSNNPHVAISPTTLTSFAQPITLTYDGFALPHGTNVTVTVSVNSNAIQLYNSGPIVNTIQTVFIQ